MEKETKLVAGGHQHFEEVLLQHAFDKKLNGKFLEASKILDQLSRELRNDDDSKQRRFVMLEAARIYLLLGKYARARSYTEAAHELFPDDEEVQVIFAKICIGEYRYDAAEFHLNKLPDDNPEKHVSLCLIAIKERRLLDAQQALHKAHNYVDPEDAEYSLLWAYIQLLEGDEKNALIRVRDVMKDPPNDTHLLLLAAEIYMTSGTYGEAKKVTQLVHKYAPQHDHAFAVRAYALYAEEEYDAAEKEAYIALDFNERNAYARTVIMKCATRRGDYQFAEKVGLRILRESPGYSLGHANLGDVYFNEGDYDRAERAYDESRHLMDSLTKGAKLRKARMEFIHGNYHEAVRILRTLTQTAHSYYDDAMCDLWLCYERLGDTEKRDEILDAMELRRAFYHRTEKIMHDLKNL